ncbi:MAG: MBL fold metallo-hydrolase [Anaerolineae bacterium]
MTGQVVYCQVNKDYAYWIEKRRLGQLKGGHVAGWLSYVEAGMVKQNILFDTGLGTLEGLADAAPDTFWDEPLVVFITHGHIDHHAELMILSEIYCQRRGKNIHDVRPPVHVFSTAETRKHLFRTHRYGYTGGKSLRHRPLTPGQAVQVGLFNITPLPVDHFEGAVIFLIEFELSRPHKIIIGWDTTTLPFNYIERLRRPSLALLETTTWSPLAAEIGHSGVEDLVQSGFLAGLEVQYRPEQEQYGAYLVHYSGWEDPHGALTDPQLKATFDQTFPAFAPVVQVAQRGQRWCFS